MNFSRIELFSRACDLKGKNFGSDVKGKNFGSDVKGKNFGRCNKNYKTKNFFRF